MNMSPFLQMNRRRSLFDDGEDDGGINPYGSGTLASTPNAPMQHPMMQGQAQATADSAPAWHSALLAGIQGAQGGGGLIGGAANIAKQALLKKYASSGAAKALLSFL